MELDGLRAWIGLVERKLGMRTRVFLVLVAIAVGGAGAAIYLAIDARDTAVSTSDLRATRDELAAQIAAGGGGSELSQLEAEVTQLKSEVETLSSGGGGSKGKSGGESPSGGTSGSQPPSRAPKALLEALKERTRQ
jgi:cell division protein FtsB